MVDLSEEINAMKMYIESNCVSISYLESVLGNQRESVSCCARPRFAYVNEERDWNRIARRARESWGKDNPY